MTKEDLQAWLNRWSLVPSDGAIVLGICHSLIEEFLTGSKTIPENVATHIETFDELTDLKATRLIQKRLRERKD